MQLLRAITWLALVLLCLAQGVARAQSMQEVIGAGDTVRITAFRYPELTTESRVSEEGQVQVPLIGTVAMQGLTPEKAAALIAQRLKEGSYLHNPEITVAVVQARSRQVSVLGHVARPGRYTLDGTSARLSDVVALAGGLLPTASDILVVKRTRQGKAESLNVDLGAIIRGSAQAEDLGLASGDSVFVPKAPVVYVYGEVTRGGSYRLEPGMTVMQAISLAGGVTPRGSEKLAKLRRKTNEGGWTERPASPVDPVTADDVIFIRESIF
ncbi:MAG TPA: polysaccharide export protein EpsE [Burkholderiales bacterium]|nr:polysaccharide export protein EpsE [Burkholderiales bacterium]